MSYCTLIEFEQGGMTTWSQEFQNAYGGAARIWTDLFDRYLKDPDKEGDSWMFRSDALWALALRSDLPLFERAILVSTFDRAIVRKENFALYAGHLREFVAAYPAGARVDHLPKWAEVVAASPAEAIGFWMMSVSDNPWTTVDEETGEDVLAIGGDHIEVYEWLATPEDTE